MENYAGMLNKPPGRWLPVNPGLWAHRTYRPLKVTRSVCPGRAPCLRKGLYLCGARVPSRDTLPRSRSSGRGALPSSAAPTVPCLALPPLPAPRTPSGPSLVCPHPSLQSWDPRSSGLSWIPGVHRSHRSPPAPALFAKVCDDTHLTLEGAVPLQNILCVLHV